MATSTRAFGRELEALRLAVGGRTQAQIGEVLGVGQPRVSRLLRKAAERLQQMAPAEYEARRRQVSGRYELAYEFAMVELARSVESGRPDPKWLRLALDVLEAQRGLHGLDVQGGRKSGERDESPFEGMDERALLDEAERELAALRGSLKPDDEVMRELDAAAIDMLAMEDEDALDEPPVVAQAPAPAPIPVPPGITDPARLLAPPARPQTAPQPAPSVARGVITFPTGSR